MSFDEVRFPTTISYGSSGGPRFYTDIHTTGGGREERGARWSQARREWNVAYGIREMTDLYEVAEFFQAREGANRGFRFKDPLDFNTSSEPYVGGSVSVDDEDVVIGTGDGSTTTFQLIKKYTSGSRTHNRTITKPVAGTVVVAAGGTAQTEGVDFTVDTTTGTITFGTAPSGAVVITAGFEFDVPVRFLDDELETNFQSYKAGTASIPVIEILENTTVYNDFNFGGHKDEELSANRTISLMESRSWAFDASTSGKKVILPDPSDLPPGGEYFFIHNAGSTNTFAVEDDQGNTLVSALATGSSVVIVLAIDAASNKIWYAF